MIIDFHTHVLPPRIKEDRRPYLDADPAFAAIYGGDKVKIATADDLIESMDRDGVDISVIVNYGWSTHRFCVETNDYILESVVRFPQRLYGFGAVSALTDDVSLKEVERCAAAGARGIGEIRPDLQLPDGGDIKPFHDLLQKHNLMLLSHASEPVGHQYPGKGAATPDVLMRLIESLPDITVILAHWGGGLPFYALMPEVKKALENVWFDTAASPFLYRPEIYRQVMQLVGADRVLFGSDYPVMPASRIVKEIETAGLAEDERAAILFGNARRILGV